MRRLLSVAATILALGTLAGGLTAEAVGEVAEDPYDPVRRLMSGSKSDRREAASELIAGGDRSLVPALVDSVFFTPSVARGEVLRVLEALTGERSKQYYDWVEYVGSHGELEPREGYVEFKRSLLARIDPEYRKVFYATAAARIRIEEIISGGVRLGGIPALDEPPTIPAAQARYLKKNERVFGAMVGGEARAYPLRILSWHELLNDVIGDQPVTLSFCTLCGSGILYSAATPAGGRYTFDTSGLLYRSNKLMLDRQTYSLWSNLTGEPVVGRLARSPIQLKVLPSTLTTWDDWRRRHPETRVLDLRAIEKTVHPGLGFVYRPGAADQARRGVSFPVWQKSKQLERNTEIFALRLAGAAKAYPADLVIEQGVINDSLGGEPLVLVADPDSGAVRAYRRGEHTFRGNADRLIDGTGTPWTLTEEALEPPSGSQASSLKRLPGHLAFWFGWYGFYPDTEVYTADKVGTSR